MTEPRDWRDEAAAGLVSMLPLIGPLLAEPARRVSRGFRDEITRNQSRALKAAELLSGLTREDLAERIAADPRLIPVATRVLFAAGMTGQDEVLDALGAALGTAVSDPDSAEDVDLLLLGLQNLRRHHITLLRRATGTPQWLGMPDEGKQPETSTGCDLIEADTWHLNALAVLTHASEDSTHVVVRGLVNAGFMRGVAGAYGSQDYYVVTSLGRTLLDVLAQYGDQAT